MTTLLISPDIKWSLTTQKVFTKHGLFCDVTHTGKDAQLKSFNKVYNFFVLDLEIENDAAIDVVKYLRKNCNQSKVYVTASSIEKLNEFKLSEQELIELGITKLFFKPTPEAVLLVIQSFDKVPLRSDTLKETEELGFAQIKITDLFTNAKAASDYYLRLSSNRFIKVFHHGEIPDKNQLKKYSDDGTHFLYFKTAEQKNRITHGTAKEIIESAQLATDKYLEEIFLRGIQTDHVVEAKKICQRMYDSIVKDEDLKSYINNLEVFNPAALSHAFLVSIFSIIICKNLEWVGEKSAQTLALGALLHDIGTMQLPPDLQAMNVEDMNTEQKALYQTHPSLGAEVLKSIHGISSGVIQIVLQHHEHVNMSGYPAGLAKNKIFPLAKIVALAASFSSFIMQKEMSPIAGLKEFLNNVDHVQWYDPDLIKSLIKALK
jgi:putative nucleotidyltransferase with HDIG domain